MAGQGFLLRNLNAQLLLGIHALRQLGGVVDAGGRDAAAYQIQQGKCFNADGLGIFVPQNVLTGLNLVPGVNTVGGQTAPHFLSV